ncbi:MAG: aldehyde ferredoxin oxidoreductase N-terminal domain-containing protein [bacterium]
MSTDSKNVLYIDLSNQTYELKAHKNLNEFLGGMGIGLKLLQENLDKNPTILSCGPLSGLFPFASKVSLIYKTNSNEIKELYSGGSFASKMRLLDIDSLLIFNTPKNSLDIFITKGKVSFINTSPATKLSKPGIKFSGKTLVDNYFEFGETTSIKNLKTVTISGEGEIKIPNLKTYKEIYNNILAKRAELSVKYSTNPSCWGCPAGCEFSHQGEPKSAAILPRCLIACQFAEDIYKEIPLVFSCLTVLGLKYNHEDLEKIPNLVGDIRKDLKC